MKKELVIIAFVFAAFFLLSTNIASAQFFGYNITLKDIAKNEMVNAALLFLLIFSVSLFILKDVFQRSYGAAVIIALVVGAIGALATISFYGPIIPLLAPWMIVVALVVIALILWRFLKSFAGLLWILTALALLWLLVTRRNACGPGALLPYEACIIIDFIAISILIIAAFTIFYKMFKGWRAMPPPTPAERVTLTIGIHGNGTTSPPPGNYPCKIGSRKRVVARPGKGARFDHWELDGTNMGRNTIISVYMNTSHILTAVFTGVALPALPTRETVTLTMSVQGGGKTIPRPGRYRLRKGATIRIKAIPNPGYNFDYWIVNGSKIKGPVQAIKLIQNTNVVAVFSKLVIKALPPPPSIPALPPPTKMLALPPPSKLLALPPPDKTRLRRELEQLYLQKQKEKRELEEKLKVVIRARETCKRIIKTPGVPKAQKIGYEASSKELDKTINRIIQRLRQIKAEMREILRQMPLLR